MRRGYIITLPYKHDIWIERGLQIVLEEGLEERFNRHKQNSEAFIRGIEAMGLSMVPPEGYRLPTLNAVRIPEGVEDMESEIICLINMA